MLINKTIHNSAAQRQANLALELKEETIAADIRRDTGQYSSRRRSSFHALTAAEQGVRVPKAYFGCLRLPNRRTWSLTQNSHGRFFVGKFSPDGEKYFSACQDLHLRIYDVNTWRMTNDMYARSHGPHFRPLDADYSQDQRWVIYSTRSSPNIYLASIYGDWDVHRELNCDTEGYGLFSICFSPDSAEILAGCADSFMYIYDLNQDTRVAKIGGPEFNGHENDVNSAQFADETRNLIVSGSDDDTIMIWDRRLPRLKVGTFHGHRSGVNHIAVKGDGRYFLSSSKDQSLRLWDMRKIDSAATSYYQRRNPPDRSVMTYTGHHSIEATLIRAYFSPQHTTGQKFIYTGSSNGNVAIYDVITGAHVNTIRCHENIVRDVAWHPYLPMMLTSSWDCSIGVIECDRDIDVQQEVSLPEVEPRRYLRRFNEADPMARLMALFGDNLVVFLNGMGTG